jgi:hypothetical protein
LGSFVDTEVGIYISASVYRRQFQHLYVQKYLGKVIRKAREKACKAKIPWDLRKTVQEYLEELRSTPWDTAIAAAVKV